MKKRLLTVMNVDYWKKQKQSNVAYWKKQEQSFVIAMMLMGLFNLSLVIFMLYR